MGGKALGQRWSCMCLLPSLEYPLFRPYRCVPRRKQGREDPSRFPKNFIFQMRIPYKCGRSFSPVLLMGPGELQTRRWSGLFTQMGRIGCKVCCRPKGRRMGGFTLHSFIRSLFVSANILLLLIQHQVLRRMQRKWISEIAPGLKEHRLRNKNR